MLKTGQKKISTGGILNNFVVPMKRNFLLLVLSVFCGPCFGQNTWLAYPPDSLADSGLVDTLNYANGGGSVEVVQDERLKKIAAFLRYGEDSVEGVKIDGYRVLIFFDQDKTLAEQKKAAFISAFPEHRTYVDYMAPNYRVRVGNFRTKLEAEALKAQLLIAYPTSLIVADKIDLPVLEPKLR